MGALELRTIVMNYLNNADERLLNVVKAVVESYQENDVVAFSVNGKPLTRKQYKQELLNAEKDIELGNYSSQDDLEQESKKW